VGGGGEGGRERAVSVIESSAGRPDARTPRSGGARSRARLLLAVVWRMSDGIFGAAVILTFTAAGPGEHYR